MLDSNHIPSNIPTRIGLPTTKQH